MLYAPGLWVHWFPTSASTSSFPTGKAVFLRSPSPALLRKRVHPLVGPRLFRALPSRVRPASFDVLSRTLRCARSAFLGVRLPSSRHQLRASLQRGSSPATFPSSAFLTPATVCATLSLVGLFHPTATSRVRSPGGFPRTQPRYLVDTACPLVVDDVPLQTIARLRRSSPPRPQGFAPCPSPLPNRRFLIAVPARSPRELLLLQVLCLCAVEAPSRFLRSWPS